MLSLKSHPTSTHVFTLSCSHSAPTPHVYQTHPTPLYPDGLRRRNGLLHHLDQLPPSFGSPLAPPSPGPAPLSMTTAFLALAAAAVPPRSSSSTLRSPRVHSCNVARSGNSADAGSQFGVSARLVGVRIYITSFMSETDHLVKILLGEGEYDVGTGQRVGFER
jgi:hypothetical protein